MDSRNAPAFLLLKRNNPCLAREHFNGNTQNAREQFLKIKFLGECAGYFEQVIALTDAEIWQHHGL